MRHLISLLALCILQIVGFLIFTQGFLLSRSEMPRVSECRLPPTVGGNLISSSTPPLTNSTSCWSPLRYKRAVLIVIDALRHDFLKWNSEFAALDKDVQARDPRRFYTNCMPKMQEILKAQVIVQLSGEIPPPLIRFPPKPDQAVVFPFIADSPTVTMQRIKGLTTGSYPTFFDVRANFNSDEISEDNLIDQLRNCGRQMVFMGDDTWEALFPGRFVRSYSYPSFNVKDIHTVDDGVIDHLFPELCGEPVLGFLDQSTDNTSRSGVHWQDGHPTYVKRTRGDWDVLIAHFLGVDHVGHTYGPDHPMMSLKLQQMDRILLQVIQSLDNDTLLFVLGDHGMTAEGNHGGADDEETHAALLVYSARSLGLHQHWVAREDSQSLVEPIPGTGIKPQHIWPALAFAPVAQRMRGLDPFDPTNSHPPISQVDLVPTLALLLGVPIPFGSLGTLITDLFFFNDVEEDGTIQDCSMRAKPYARLAGALNMNVAQVDRFLEEYAGLEKSRVSWLRRIARRTVDSHQALEEIPSSACTAQMEYRRISLHYMYFLEQASRLCLEAWMQFNTPRMTLGIAVLIVCLGLGAVLFCDVVKRALGGSRFCATQLYSVEFVVGFATVLLHCICMFSNSFIIAEASLTRFLSTSLGLVIPLGAARRCYGADRSEWARVLRTCIAVLAASLCGRASGVMRIGVDSQLACIAPSLSPACPWGTVLCTISSSAMARAIVETFVPLCVLMVTGWRLLRPGRSCGISRLGCWLSVWIWELSCSLLGIFWGYQCWTGGIENGLSLYAIPRFIFFVGFIALLNAFAGPPFRRLVLVSAACIPLVIVALGPMSPRTVVLLGAQAMFFLLAVRLQFPEMSVGSVQVNHTSTIKSANTATFTPHTASFACVCVFWFALWGWQIFYDTGHRPQFNTLHISAAFVLSPDYSFLLCGALMLLNTFGPTFLHVIVLPDAVAWAVKTTLVRTVSWLGLLSLMWQSLMVATCTTLFVFVERHHLMVHALFAPKYLYDAPYAYTL